MAALGDVPFGELVDRVAAVLGEERPDVAATFGPDGITGTPTTSGSARPQRVRSRASPGTPVRGFAGWCTAGPASRSSTAGTTPSRGGLPAWDPDTVDDLRGIPDERIDVDIDTTDVAPLVAGAMQEHRTQWNDINNPEATEEQRLKSVSRETEVITWPPTRPGRVLSDIFEGL